MDRVYHSERNPFGEVRFAGIAIGEVGDDQRHTGLLHRDEETGDVLMLHLKWHHKLRNEPPSDGFLWVDPAFHPKRLAHVADLCRLVWRANGKDGIPFGFSPATDCFDPETGMFLLGPTGLGLTCATFILTIFHRVGLPLLVYQSWPTDRQGDKEWQQKIVRWLEKTGASPEHIDGVRSDVGSVRFRPEEVAGAATVSPLPAEFANAAERGQQILDRLFPAGG